MYKPEGILVAMVTPMTDDEKINEQEMRNQVRRMIMAGIHGIFCLGTNGEFYALDYQEKIEVMEIVVDECKGRVPVCAGTGCITTSETIKLSKEAHKIGVDAISVITPFFVTVSQDELYKHYAKIAESIELPMILYNIPERTRNSIDYKTVAKLSQLSNIVGIKDSSGNFDNTLRYLEETERNFAVMSGNDSLILWTLMAGGKGGVSGIANLFPETLVKIYELWGEGKIEEAIKIQNSIRPIRDTLKFANPNSVIKRAMNLLGYPVGPAREPVSIIPKRLDEELKMVLNLYQIK